MKKFSLKHCSYFLIFLLSACGVKGPLYFPTPKPPPVQPSLPEPLGKQYQLPTPSEPSKTDK